ncbi:MAG: LOG family protein [Chloroflexi bacterium]|nr:LOG family protein [Chloroflexota bacterium]
MNNQPARQIAVFGGSRVQPDSPEYAEAYAVGKLIARAGWTVINGGYSGTMEASARGAKENGGRTLGVTSAEFVRLAPNNYLDEELKSADLFERIRAMFQRADAFIVLKGSMGTLAELTIVWNLARIDKNFLKPIILLGSDWARVLETWRAHLAVTEEETNLLRVVTTPEQVIELLKKEL